MCPTFFTFGYVRWLIGQACQAGYSVLSIKYWVAIVTEDLTNHIFDHRVCGTLWIIPVAISNFWECAAYCKRISKAMVFWRCCPLSSANARANRMHCGLWSRLLWYPLITTITRTRFRLDSSQLESFTNSSSNTTFKNQVEFHFFLYQVELNWTRVLTQIDRLLKYWVDNSSQI